MSRICGIVNVNRSREQLSQSLELLLRPLIHSADFSTDSVCLDSVTFGRSFFSALNFSTHLHASDDGSVICAFSGYLFDPDIVRKQVLRESQGTASVANPAALLAYLFPHHRTELLASLSGSYVFALWEVRSRTLTLGSDRFGMTPLYYRHRGTEVSFASEIKALTNLEPDPEINQAALSELLALGSAMGSHTLYPSIFRLPPASVISFCDGNSEIERYWTCGDVRPDANMNLPDFVEEAKRLFGKSVSRLTGQVEKPICLLSAGYDSRRILLEMVQQGKSVTAYTTPTVQSDSPLTHDVPIARALCQELGVKHVGVELPPAASYGEITRHVQTLIDFETGAHAWVLPLVADIPAASGINFDGLAGDTLYESNFTYADEAAHMAEPGYLVGSVLNRFPDLWKSCFRIDAPKPSLAERIESALRNLPDNENRLTCFYFGNWTRRKISLFANGLLSLKIDSVYPFLDYALVDHVLRLPPLTKRTAEISRLMLDLTDPELMRRIPTSHDKRLSSVDDESIRPFQMRLPHNYWRDTQRSISRAAAIDIVKAGSVFPKLSRPTQLAVIGNIAALPNWSLPRNFVLSSWRMDMAGLYALQRRTARSRSFAARRLAAANAYVYRGVVNDLR